MITLNDIVLKITDENELELQALEQGLTSNLDKAGIYTLSIEHLSITLKQIKNFSFGEVLLKVKEVNTKSLLVIKQSITTNFDDNSQKTDTLYFDTAKILALKGLVGLVLENKSFSSNDLIAYLQDEGQELVDEDRNTITYDITDSLQGKTFKGVVVSKIYSTYKEPDSFFHTFTLLLKDSVIFKYDTNQTFTEFKYGKLDNINYEEVNKDLKTFLDKNIQIELDKNISIKKLRKRQGKNQVRNAFVKLNYDLSLLSKTFFGETENNLELTTDLINNTFNESDTSQF
jgi:hypothetical protein